MVPLRCSSEFLKRQFPCTYIVLGIVGGHDEEFKFNTLGGTSGDEHVFWPSTTAVFSGVLGCALSCRQLFESVGVSQSHVGVKGVSVDKVLSWLHWNQNIRNNCLIVTKYWSGVVQSQNFPHSTSRNLGSLKLKIHQFWNIALLFISLFQSFSLLHFCQQWKFLVEIDKLLQLPF